MKKVLIFMSILSMLFGCHKQSATTYPQDVVTAADGSQITFTFYAHASFSIAWQGKTIYIDPVGEFDWDSQPKGDIILITHSHYDHLELPTIERLRGESGVVVCDKTSADAFEHDCITMLPGSTANPLEGITIKATPAYNITEGHTDFHPQSREDCGYLITLGGTTIYVAGDTENNADVLSIKGVDIAFLPVNQPYTMTVEQAAEVVSALRPQIFYPYHYGQVDDKTDIEALRKAVEGITDCRVFPME